MESVVIETLGCPLDPDLLKSWEKFRLEASHSRTSSDHSKSADEENEIKHDDLIEQLKNLSFDDVSDSKYITSKRSNKISEINSQEKDISGEPIFVENKETEENQSSSSSLKNKELLKFVVEADTESTFCKCSNKNYETNSKKKNNTEKPSFVENFEDIGNQLSSLSIKNNKLLNKYYKSGSDISAGYESDSDDNEEVESVTLRERDPTRHNRPENNKQLRPTPFSRNHTKTTKPHCNSNNSQTFGNFSPDIFCDSNTSHNVSPSSRTFHSGFPTSESVTDEEFEGMVSRILADPIFNNIIPCTAANQIVNGIVPYTATNQIVNSMVPCTAANQIVNGVVPCTVTDQIVNGIIPCTAANHIVNGMVPCTAATQIANGIVPCTVTDQIVAGVIPHTVNEVLDSVFPTANDIGNASDKFSEEINDIPCFDDLKERIISGCVVTNEDKETFLDSCEENLTEKDVEITDSSWDGLYSQNYMDLLRPLHVQPSKEVEKVFNNSSILNQNITFKEISHPNNNQHNFHPEPDHGHSSFSKENVGENSLFSNLCKENDILEKSDQFYNSECLMNKPGNYSNLVCKNITSINCESLSPEISDYIIISNEIEDEILKLEELEERVKKGQKNVSELSREIDWNVLPFDELDDNEISECTNTSQNKITYKSNDSKRKNINKTCKSPCKTKETKIYSVWGTVAKHKLFHDSSFCKSKWERENEKIRQQIECGMLGTEEKKVIHVLKKNRTTKYRGTNLHYAILSENTEKVFCIVECHKEYHDGIFEINLQDS
ncbi:hypothetical protein AVEN_185385-1, partial [Araneus ventricosus]